MKFGFLLFLFALAVGADLLEEGKVEVNGNLYCRLDGSAYDFSVGPSDPFSRPLLSWTASNDADPANVNGTYAGDGSMFALGAFTADGDPENVISEGMKIAGQNEGGGAMNHTDWGYARVKPARFQLRQAKGGVQEDIFRVDPSKLKWRDTFDVTSTKTTISNILTLEGDGSFVFEAPEDFTSLHLTDYSFGRIIGKMGNYTVYLPVFLVS